MINLHINKTQQIKQTNLIRKMYLHKQASVAIKGTFLPHAHCNDVIARGKVQTGLEGEHAGHR